MKLREILSRETYRNDRGLYLICGLLSITILFIDLSIPLGVAGGVPYIAVVLLSLWSPKTKFTINAAVICSILTVIGFYYSPSGGEMWKVLFNRALALFAIWVTAVLTLHRKTLEKKQAKAVLDREKALEDLKILRGLLPICASCKRIRDDEGYWNQIESYITLHSEAAFTHGICPECSKRLYPELLDKKNLKATGLPGSRAMG